MREEFLGVPTDILSLNETVDLADKSMSNRQRCQHVALNVAKFMEMRMPNIRLNLAYWNPTSKKRVRVAGCAKTFGVPIDILSLNETVDLADKSMSAALPTHVMLVMN